MKLSILIQGTVPIEPEDADYIRTLSSEELYATIDRIKEAQREFMMKETGADSLHIDVNFIEWEEVH